MSVEEKVDMLLFCKERLQNPTIYALYFTTMDTLSSASPRIHRFVVSSAKKFDEFSLGGYYWLKINKIRILEFAKTDEMILTDQLYLNLLELRELKFMNPRTADSLRARGLPLFRPDQYYTFSEARAISEYSPDVLDRLLIWFTMFVLYGVGLLLPFGGYCLIVYSWIRKILAVPLGAETLAPTMQTLLIAICSLPLMLYLMTFLFALIDNLTMQLPWTRWFVLKRYSLQWCGLRKAFRIPMREIRRLIILGAISVAAFAAGLIFSGYLPKLFG